MTVALAHVHDFLSKLRGVVPDGDNKWLAYCPVHEATGEHRPSLGVTIGSEDKVILKCLACPATTVDIVHAAGSTMRALYPPTDFKHRRGKQSRGRKVAEYIYRDAEGAIVYKTERRELPDGTKSFLQSRPNGQGGWILGVKGLTKVLYNLPEIIAAKPGSRIFVVEGEKKAEALRDWGLTATCNVGGAGKWSKSYGKYFAGHDVIVLPDNDPVNTETGRRTGYEHATDIIDSVRSIAKSVRILELPGLPLKGDIVDWIEAGGTLPQLLALLDQPAGELPPPKVEHKDSVTPVDQMDPLDIRVVDSRSDIGNGKRFIKISESKLRYCYPWKKWLQWDGNRWVVDQTGFVFRNAKEVSSRIWDEIRQIGRDVDESTLASMMMFAKSSGGDGAICRMIHCAESEDGHQFIPDELDSNPWLLNVQNGTIDMRDGCLKPHSMDDFITQIAPVSFDVDATCPVWESFLLKIFDTQEMVDYIQRLCGCWATGIIREESLPILWGIGSNGKTTFVNAIMSILGSDYCMKAPTDFLMVKKFQGHPTEKADLFRKRFVVCSETDEGGRLDEATVKDLTGRERIRARRMREDNWEFEPTHKVLLMTNHLPHIRGTDHGIWRRIRKIEFAKQFWNPDTGETGPPELMRDNTIADRIIEEYPGILTWIVKGAVSWYQDGELAPSYVTNCTSEYRASQDVLRNFIEECCVEGIAESVTPGDLYKRFTSWAKECNEFAFKKTKFGTMMRERGYVKDLGNRFYLGIGITE